MTARCVALAALVALGACGPVLYELHDSDGAGTSESVSETMSSETAPDTLTPPDPTLPTGGPVELCFDGLLDGDETDVDCGGPCPPCPPGGTCVEPKDCVTGECVAGVCDVPVQCQVAEDCPAGPCSVAKCDQGQCFFADLDGIDCDDGQLCTDVDVCIAGECVGLPRDCSGFDQPCQHGFCNPVTGNCAVEFAEDGDACEDGLACTMGDFCVQGACLGEQAVLGLFTDFTTPDGWWMDPPWMIGQAKQSACDLNGLDDPSEDHSPGNDNMLAGAAIGDCLPPEPLPEEVCLTSPEMNLAEGQPIVLMFWSELSVGPPPASAHVDVWEGKTWETVFPLEDEPLDEPEWTQHFIDITPHANSMLMVRFCHLQPEPGPFPVAGWSVDDVYVGPPECAKL
ncbi:hypothetical protein [Nannocystis radixulma]|uniref:MAM domain-containing protein n=1 Tax=Nannocystis radixulma TaxID=2995305 RepID=A0ABT5B7G5_9BACT|nr:hypothetical protein [Nannocystis radixulma]MDC0670052.1 hypothetical protein [Nannocystis radixulma]